MICEIFERTFSVLTGDMKLGATSLFARFSWIIGVYQWAAIYVTEAKNKTGKIYVQW